MGSLCFPVWQLAALRTAGMLGCDDPYGPFHPRPFHGDSMIMASYEPLWHPMDPYGTLWVLWAALHTAEGWNSMSIVVLFNPGHPMMIL